jgi:hypothetical protein
VSVVLSTQRDDWNTTTINGIVNPEVLELLD